MLLAQAGTNLDVLLIAWEKTKNNTLLIETVNDTKFGAGCNATRTDHCHGTIWIVWAICKNIYPNRHKTKAVYLGAKMKLDLQDKDSHKAVTADYQLNKAWPFKAVAKRSNGILCCTSKGTQSRKSKLFWNLSKAQLLLEYFVGFEIHNPTMILKHWRKLRGTPRERLEGWKICL